MVRTVAVCTALMISILPAARAQPAAIPAGSPQAIDSFVTSFASPTRMTGKIARWEDGICPLTVGQQPAVTQFVTQRVKDVATMVGAPVNASQSCTPNIEIDVNRIP